MEFVEKDYWITYILSRLSTSKHSKDAVFKGGTSLSKGYGLISRFSEDVDIAICNAEEQSDNRVKVIIRSIEKEITVGLTECDVKGITSKGSRFRKSVYQYNSTLDKTVSSNGSIIVEVNSFANPYPFESLQIESFIAKFLKEQNELKHIDEFGLQGFEINILDKRQTLVEKLVSLIRVSSLGKEGLLSKIRHFYDIHSLMEDDQCMDYVQNGDFCNDFKKVLEHDKVLFEDPSGWQNTELKDLPLFYNTENTWNELVPRYKEELSALAFAPIPDQEKILDSIALLINKLS